MVTMDLQDIARTMTSEKKLTRWIMVFVFQCPLMFFSFTVAAFLTGLFAVVLGAVGTNPIWDGSAKVR